jgi:hypothetical protein
MMSRKEDKQEVPLMPSLNPETNTLSGSAFVYHRNDKLSNQNDIRGNKRIQDFYNTQWGFSLGGPVIRDKMHFFVAFDRQDAGDPTVYCRY